MAAGFWKHILENIEDVILDPQEWKDKRKQIVYNRKQQRTEHATEYARWLQRQTPARREDWMSQADERVGRMVRNLIDERPEERGGEWSNWEPNP